MPKTTQRRRLTQLLPLPAGRWPPLTPIQTSLFDFAAVSQDDCETWMRAVVPHVAPPRWPQYIRSYRVADKVAHAKNTGKWPPKSGGFHDSDRD